MTEKAVIDGGLSNNKDSPCIWGLAEKKMDNCKGKAFKCTINNYDDEIVKKLDVFLNSNAFKFIYGFEVGLEGTPHLQIYCRFEKETRRTSIKNAIGIEFYIELTRKSIGKTIDDMDKDNFIYCSKGGNYVSNYKYKQIKPIKLIDKLYSWQEEIKSLCQSEPDGRSIHWLIDYEGGKGKSSFCKYMAIKHNVLVIQGGKLTDIMNIIFNSDMNEIDCVFIDVPRKNTNKVSYNAIECILNGMITNTKFETGVKIFNAPHVFVFSNFAPDTKHMSFDRWDIKEVTQGGVLQTLTPVTFASGSVITPCGLDECIMN